VTDLDITHTMKSIWRDGLEIGVVALALYRGLARVVPRNGRPITASTP
jgi:hypothetical protein